MIAHSNLTHHQLGEYVSVSWNEAHTHTYHYQPITGTKGWSEVGTPCYCMCERVCTVWLHCYTFALHYYVTMCERVCTVWLHCYTFALHYYGTMCVRVCMSVCVPTCSPCSVSQFVVYWSLANMWVLHAHCTGYTTTGPQVDCISQGLHNELVALVTLL